MIVEDAPASAHSIPRLGNFQFPIFTFVVFYFHVGQEQNTELIQHVFIGTNMCTIPMQLLESILPTSGFSVYYYAIDRYAY